MKKTAGDPAAVPATATVTGITPDTMRYYRTLRHIVGLSRYDANIAVWFGIFHGVIDGEGGVMRKTSTAAASESPVQVIIEVPS